ncbi:MAG: S41 family peptidase, partial [Gemmatirosa sp.]
TLRAIALAATLVLLPTVARAQAQATHPALDGDARRAIVDSVARVLEARYVDTTIARRIGVRLRAQLARRAYDAITSAPDCATTLMRDLQGVVADRHLRVTYEPERDFAAIGPAARESGPRMVMRPPPSAATGATPAPGTRAPWTRIDGRDSSAIARTNFAFERVERLPGNVGYIRLHQFVPLDLSRDTWLAALAFLRNVDALIVDVRDNVGGAPDALQFLLGHFVRDRRLLFAAYNRAADRTFEHWAEPDTSRPSFQGVDLYVVQDRNSASTAEIIGYVTQHNRLGTVVGDTTAGAGNGGSKVSVGAGLALFIPQFRIVTGPGFERTGVVPDVWAPSDRAPAVAHQVALQRLTQRTAEPAVARERAFALELVTAASRAPRASDRALSTFAGSYGGRRFQVRDGALLLVGATGRTSTLTRANDLVFRSPTARYRFEVDATGAAVAVRVEPMDGAALRDARSVAR